MSLQAGTSLGHYRVGRKLGAGGMGEVYLAMDTRLDREVALKILPADFARDPGRMRRFTQEAKVSSGISHPNVAHIYDFGNDRGADTDDRYFRE